MRLRDALAHFRWPAAMIVVSVVVFAIAAQARQHREETLHRLGEEIRRLEAELDRRVVQARLGERLLPSFEQLVEAGFLDPARSRPAWIQALSSAAEAAAVHRLAFRMSEPKAVDQADLRVPGYRLLEHPVFVELQLFHEGDLMLFLKGLLRHPAGVMQNRYCIVRSLMKQAGLSLQAPNLQASCRFDWYALAPMEEGEDPDALEEPGDVEDGA